jgi:hypothetical protein
MKHLIKTILLLVLIGGFTSSFAEEISEVKNKKMTYMTIGGMRVSCGGSNAIAPKLSLGRRYIWGDDAVDISVAFAFVENNDVKHYYGAYPTLRYLHYFNNNGLEGVYLGGGMAYGHVKKSVEEEFFGALANFTVGYEFDFSDTICQMVELQLVQPAIAMSKKGEHPGPSVALVWGIGF